MKKLLPYAARVLFAVFVIGVAGAVMFYSWNGLGLIFPGDLLGQAFGMLLFDVSMIVWFLVLVAACASTMQYVWSLIGFLIGLAGTLGLVGIEVGLSSGMLEPGTMQKELTYIFIGVMIGHLILIYAHHASSPQVSADISLGIERAKITDEAQKDAEHMLQANIAQLSAPIARRLVQDVIEHLGLRPTRGDVIDLDALEVVDAGRTEDKKAGGFGANFLSWLIPGRANGAKRYESSAPSVEKTSRPQTRTPSPAQDDVGLEGGGGNEPKS